MPRQQCLTPVSAATRIVNVVNEVPGTYPGHDIAIVHCAIARETPHTSISQQESAPEWIIDM